MSIKKRGGSRQPELFPRSKCPTIPIADNHRLVVMANEIDWTEYEELIQAIRMSKLKNAAGRPPQLRALGGALALRATRKMTYRDTEDQIRYHAPSRYLCGLTETDWSPDANTIQDFEQLLGEDGMRQLNEYLVKWAVDEKLADPSLVVADTTAQEAAIPYPNEVGHMASFLNAVVAASGKVGKVLVGFVKGLCARVKTAKKKVRAHRLFAKTASAKKQLTKELAAIVEGINTELGQGLDAAKAQGERLKKQGKVAWNKLNALHGTMSKLLPQIRYWLRTGKVAAGKVINIHIPELYSIVRGKAGKAVEFGLKWGFARLRGGFILATVARGKGDMPDSRFALQAVDQHIALFGKPPKSYAYDRGGYSRENIKKLKAKGVKEVGLAPRGRAKWAVANKVKEKLVNERAQVEGSIGTVKSPRYGFNRPSVRSAEMMGVSGQRSVFGLNLNKLIRGLAERKELVLVG
ncbi:MAG: transposase [Planctomycetota bacterium]|jgi:IS5 family transposase